MNIFKSFIYKSPHFSTVLTTKISKPAMSSTPMK